MDVIVHVIGPDGLIECTAQIVSAHANIEGDGFSALEQPIQVFLEEDEDALVQAHGLPNAISHEIAAIKNGDARLIPWH
jgi:hypothetical protein